MLGHRFSIVTVLDSVVPMIDNLAKLYGMADKLASIRVIDIPVLDLESDPARLTQELARASLAAFERAGAHALVLGCTGFLCSAQAIGSPLAAKCSSLLVLDPSGSAAFRQILFHIF